MSNPSAAAGAPSTSANSTSKPHIKVESLGQLYTRLSADRRAAVLQQRHRRVPLLPPQLFVHSTNAPPPPLGGHIIEITGDVNTGKTHLLMELIVRAVLPQHFLIDGGCDSAGANDANVAAVSKVLLIDTEHQLHIFKLSAMLEKRISAASAHLISGDSEDAEQRQLSIRRTIDQCLQRVHLLKCHTAEHLELAIGDLDRHMRTGDVALLAIDSVATFYWAQEFIPATTAAASASSSAFPVRMDTHVRRLVGQLHRIASKYGAVLAFVRPAGFGGRPLPEARSRRRRHDGSCVSGVDDDEDSGDAGAIAAKPAQEVQLVDFTVTLMVGSDGEEQKHVDEATIAASGPKSSFCAVVAVRGLKEEFSCGFAIDDFGIVW